MSENLLELNHITKIFPGVKALDDVHFNLRKGEIHALVGENGAGKSTFIKVITGAHRPDGGEILLDGKPIAISNPIIAMEHGIAAIYQHLAAYPHLTVAENIFIGNERLTGPVKRISWKKTNAMAKELLASLGSDISPTERMGVLSVAQQQLVEIAKALSRNARILIMDEPTAALSKRESEELYKIVTGLRSNGTSIILISHRFEDTFKLADRVTVFRDARYIGTWDVRDVTSETLVKHMVGRSIDQYFPSRKASPGEELLRVEGLSRLGYFANVSFSLHAGEILGFTGLVGSGRTEVIEALCGVTRLSSGRIFIQGKETAVRSPNEALALGIGLLPEDRQKQGLLLPWPIGRNISLPSIARYAGSARLLNVRAENREAEDFTRKLAVKAVSIADLAASLSGGNQQKVVIAKLLASRTRILIMDEPTKGVDVGSKAQIYQFLCDLAGEGFGILVISSEMLEVLNISDRILVMREGRVSEVIPRADATQERILTAAMPLEKRT